MSNPFYTAPNFPLDFTRAKAAPMRAQLAAVAAGFDAVYTRLNDAYQVTPEQFGAVGDGANSVADTAALLAFNAWAKALPANSLVELHMRKGGQYLIADPRWPMNIPFLNVYGNKCSIKNSATINNLKLLLLPSYGLLGPIDAAPTYGNVTRSLIASTVAGQKTIQLSTIGEAASYVVGQTIMVASFLLQFGGFPQSFKYFEFPIITGINAGTGLITLDRRLKFAHLSTCPYLTSYSEGEGRAHIEKIEQGSLWNIHHNYRDITFLKNDVSAAGAVTEAPYSIGRDVRFHGCAADYLLATINEYTERNDCTVYGAAEYDKLVGAFVGNRNTYFGQMASATSVLSLRETGTTFAAGYNLGPARLDLIDCTVTGASQADVKVFASYGFVQSLNIVGGTHQFFPDYSVTSGQCNTLVEGATGIAWTAGTSSLSVAFATNAAAQGFIAQAFPGMRIFATDNTSGAEVPTGIYGAVESIVSSGNGVAVIVIAFNGDPTGKRLTIFPEPWKTNLDGQRDYVLTVKGEYTIRNLRVTSGYSILNVPCFGQLTDFRCDVVRPYTGATAGNITLQVYDSAPVYQQTIKQVDLKSAGTRVSNQIGNAGFSGAGGESAPANLSTGSFASRVSSRFELSASAMASTSPKDLPVVNLRLAFECPLRF